MESLMLAMLSSRLRGLKVRLHLAPWFLLLPLLATPLPAAEDPVLQTLVAVKAAYRAKHWAEADLELRHLLELAVAPEREPALPRILPAYHFYAAAVAWALKDEDRARRELARFFEFQPDATIDPGLYPKRYCAFFDAQRTAAARAAPPAPAAAGPPPNLSTIAADETTVPPYTGDTEWPKTAVRHLLTEAEKKEFASLTDDASRREWVLRFWKKFDPDPSTPENEYELEFYRRVQYADAAYSTESVRGCLSDRGRVLLVLGPPSYVGKMPLLRSNDIMTSLKTTEPVIRTSPSGGASIVRVPTTNRGKVTPGDVEGDVEVWYYRSDRIPKGLPFRDLEYRFYTKEGYGTGVFQKDARELLALQKATRLLRTGG
ncbi:MAG TPA: GWxTD domain-containing protein [Thermoanaerobaculia bacterium]|nr:GWxTD domain-containing protein [Thermoanaerobaculia bacterium]